MLGCPPRGGLSQSVDPGPLSTARKPAAARLLRALAVCLGEGCGEQCWRPCRRAGRRHPLLPLSVATRAVPWSLPEGHRQWLGIVSCFS